MIGTPGHLELVDDRDAADLATFLGRARRLGATAVRLQASGRILAGWVSRADLARELGLTEDTLRRWEDRRTGPACVRAGRSWPGWRPFPRPCLPAR